MDNRRSFLLNLFTVNQEKVTIGVDIYAFGICALEMAVVDIQGNGESKKKCISREAVLQAVEGLKDVYQKVIRRLSPWVDL